MNSVPTKNIDLSISGVNIRFKFYPTQFTFSQERLFNDIVSYYYECILTDLHKKPDYIIRFTEGREIFVGRANKTEYAFRYYRNITETTIETYYFVSIEILSYLLRKLVFDHLNSRGGIWLHTSAVAINRRVLLFVGPSGAGKTTIRKMLQDIERPLSDDDGIIRMEDGRYRFFQTPMFDKNAEITKTSQSYPIKAIYFISQSDRCQCTGLTDPQTIIARLNDQIWTYSPDQKKIMMKNVFHLVKNFHGWYALKFNRQVDQLKASLSTSD